MSAPMEKHGLVNGFSVIPVRFKEKSKSHHYIYVKEHNVRESHVTKPRDRTLFALNVPPYCGKESLKGIFSKCGTVQNVFLHKKPNAGQPEEVSESYFDKNSEVKGFKVAYIVFESAKSVQKAKQMPRDVPCIISTGTHKVETGLKKWCSQYRQRHVDTKKLQSEIDVFLSAHDESVKQAQQAAKEMENVEDEEGWVTVTKHGRNKGIPRTEAQEQKITRKEKRKRKQKELLNFYSFQMRESKREHIAKLREKFEEDKLKIDMMKTARKFKPY